MPQPSAEEWKFLKAFFQSVVEFDQPLETNDERYVRLYEDGSPYRARGLEDPVDLLATAIRYRPGQSVQLLSGFRGTGKSTELKRLEKTLVEAAYQVVYIDLKRHINTSMPVDISDFLMVLAGAFGEALQAPEHLGRDMAKGGFWDGVVDFLSGIKIGVPEISAYGLKANLKSDPSFRTMLQEKMAGHLGALVDKVNKFFEDCVKALKDRHSADTEIVMIVDSIEHIRGAFSNAREVQESVEMLFTRHADKLRIPNIHVVYTVPPYLKARAMNLGALYAMGAVQMFPAIKIRDQEGSVHYSGVEAMKEIVRKRGDWTRLLGNEKELEKIVLVSGGNLRDLLRLMAEVIRRAKILPVQSNVVNDAIEQIRAEFLPIANDDAMWLSQIAETHSAQLDSMERLPNLARFFDTHVVLCYRDGPEWYDVHPMIRDVVIKQAKELSKRDEPADGLGQ